MKKNNQSYFPTWKKEILSCQSYEELHLEAKNQDEQETQWSNDEDGLVNKHHHHHHPPVTQNVGSAESTKMCKKITNRRSSNTPSISQSFLKPNSWIQEFFHAEVTENWLKILANLHEGFIFLFKRLFLYIL